MNIKHHPTDQTLMAYASGSLSQAMELLIATHMTVCPHCRNKVAGFEAMAGPYWKPPTAWPWKTIPLTT